MDFLRKACFFSLCTVSPLRVGLLTSLCLLSACQTGFGSRAVFQRITLESTLAPSARVELVDVGGHLAPDIVVMTHRPGRLYWFENPTWRNHQVGVTADEFYGLAVLPKIQGEAGADLALSGRFSQPGAGTYEQIIWLRNEGRQADENLWTFRPVRSDIQPGDLFTADMSGTGRRVLGSLPDLAIHSRVRSQRQWVTMPLLDNPPSNPRVRVFDWDLNGRDDLLVMSDRGLDILALASRGRFVDEFRLFATPPGQGFLDVGVGQSGRPARRFIAAISEDGSRLQVFRPDPSSPTGWDARTLGGALKAARVLKVADLNLDDVDELILGGMDGLFVYYYDREKSVWQRYQIDSSPVADIAIGDLTGDGFPEMVTTPAEAGVVKLYQNRGRSN